VNLENEGEGNQLISVLKSRGEGTPHPCVPGCAALAGVQRPRGENAPDYAGWTGRVVL